MSQSELGDELPWEEIMGKSLMIQRRGSVDGSHGKIAEMGTTVVCNLKGYMNSVLFEEVYGCKYKIGEGDAVPGLEMAMRYSHRQETLRVKFNSRFGYGTVGRPAIAISNVAPTPSTNSGSEIGKIGTKSIPAIPPDTDLEYEIEVVNHIAEGEIDPDILHAHGTSEEDLPAATSDTSAQVVDADSKVAERMVALTEITLRKEAGNRWFSYGDFTRAAQAYSKGTQIADRYFNSSQSGPPGTTAGAGAGAGAGGAVGQSPEAKAAVDRLVNSQAGASPEALKAAEEALAKAEEEKQRKQQEAIPVRDQPIVGAYVHCLNNMAACLLKKGEASKAKDVCVRVLELDPVNQKALLRAAKAALATHAFDECDLCLQRLAAVAPVGSSAAGAAQEERRRLKTAQKEYRAQNKSMSANIARQLQREKQRDERQTNGQQQGAETQSISTGSSRSSERNSTRKTEVEVGAEAEADSRVVNSGSRGSSGTSSDGGSSGGGSDIVDTRSTELSINNSTGTSATGSTNTDSSHVTPAAAAATASASASAAVKAPKPAAQVDRHLLMLLLTSMFVLVASIGMLLFGKGGNSTTSSS